jgi:ABC-2 type transport system ATP-binding protein
MVTIEGPAAAVEKKLASLPGIIRVTRKKQEFPEVINFLVETQKGVDIRKSLATTITGSNWGLLEMKTVEMSLEEIFLKLVTEEKG